MRFWPFGPRRFLDPTMDAWAFDVVGWFLSEFGGLAELRRSRVWQPTPERFPVSAATGHARAEEIFARVKELAGLTDWPVRLEAQTASVPTQVGEMLHLQADPRPGGTFRVGAGAESQEIVISYNPDLLDQPMALIATFAHELAHYLLATAQSDPPGGTISEEMAADAAAVLMGFGVFLANSAFLFEQYSDGMVAGWQSRQRGYLSERTLVFLHAVFVTLVEADAEESERYLKESLRRPFRKALDSLSGHPGMRELEAGP